MSFPPEAASSPPSLTGGIGLGLAAAIIGYSYASGGGGPSLLYIVIVGFVWLLMFQFMLNLVFVNDFR